MKGHKNILTRLALVSFATGPLLVEKRLIVCKFINSVFLYNCNMPLKLGMQTKTLTKRKTTKVITNEACFG